MNIFTRRNAVIGFLVLKALKRARRSATVGYVAAQGMERTRAHRRNGRGLRILLFVVLAVVSLGLLAGLAGAVARRKAAAAESVEAPVESAEIVAEQAEAEVVQPEAAEGEAEVVGEVVAAPEPISAT